MSQVAQSLPLQYRCSTDAVLWCSAVDGVSSEAGRRAWMIIMGGKNVLPLGYQSAHLVRVAIAVVQLPLRDAEVIRAGEAAKQRLTAVSRSNITCKCIKRYKRS
jgi:hypothetical protein